MDPYYIFPRELWEKIFNLVENPQDKLSLIRTHPNLQNQFRAMEGELLFLSALPFILDNLESSARQIKYSSQRQEQRKVFLAFRSVSSSSCKVVDKWMESIWEKSTGAHRPPSFLDRGVRVGRRFGLCNVNVMHGILVKFEEDFSNHPEDRTPLLSRFVTTWIPSDAPEHALHCNGLERFYIKAGRHLRKLQVYLTPSRIRRGEFRLPSFSSLRNVLELTPNLQSLSFEFWSQSFNYLLEVNPQQFQFPELPQLDHLVWGFWDERDVVLNTFASIREYFPQLVELEIRNIFNFRDDYLENVELFPNLKTLKLERTASSTDSNSWEPKLRSICEKIRAPKLTLFEVNFGWAEATVQAQMETLTRDSLICLNKMNTCYSHLEPEFQWTASYVVCEGGFMEIKFLRKLK